MHGKDEILSKMWTRFIQIVDLKFRICYIVDGSPPIKVVDLAPAKVTTFSFAFTRYAITADSTFHAIIPPMNPIEPRLVDSGSLVDSSGLVHRVYEPTPPGPRPTVIMVHGRQGDENVMWIFKNTLPADWLLIAPRAPQLDTPGNYSWDVRPSGQWPRYDDLLPGAITLLDFIHALPDHYAVDWGQLYLMGFSQGAAVSLVAAMQDDVPLRAVASLVGFMPVVEPETAIGLRDMPVFMSVGRQDESVPCKVAERTAKTLIDVGARLDYRSYDTGHRLNARGMRDLKAWWQRRANDDNSDI